MTGGVRSSDEFLLISSLASVPCRVANFGEYDYICVKTRGEAEQQALSEQRDTWVAEHMALPSAGTFSPAACIRREYLDLLEKDQGARAEQFNNKKVPPPEPAEEESASSILPDRPQIEKREAREDAYQFTIDPGPTPDPALHKEFRQLSDTLSFLRRTREPCGTNEEHTVEGEINAALNDLRPRSSAIPRPEGPKEPTPEEMATSWREEARARYPLAQAAEDHFRAFSDRSLDEKWEVVRAEIQNKLKKGGATMHGYQEAINTRVQVAMYGAPGGRLPVIRNYGYGERWDSSRGATGGTTAQEPTELLRHRLADQAIHRFDRNVQAHFELR